ncbi:MAG: ABC transporter permease [Kiritimatiellae bacterium]|nr:ABC transporter permease [Kiritimatiellia bacterium]MBR1836196.1 ABC transporter permease [Kiritimatiellia bacterium]
MRTPRFAVFAFCAYLVAAAFGEAAYRSARARDETPEYNVVRQELRYLPPLSRAADRDGRVRFFLLGTDNLGRDVALRLVQGARIAVQTGVVSALLAVPFGTLLGLLAGYFGGRTDAAVSWLCATVAAIPAPLLVLAVSLVAGKGLFGVYLGIGITTWVGVCRTVRGETARHRNRAYVLAAEALGCPPWRILLRHVLPNVSHLVVIAFSLRFPAAIGTEVFMSFLGLGAQNEPSWGVMIGNARVRLWQGMWWEGAFTTLAVFGLVLSANRLGDWLRDRLDPAAA